MLRLFALLLISIQLYAQDAADLFEYEKLRYLNFKGYSGYMYPGDSTINITWYGLDLNISYGPDYLSGSVAVSARSNVPGLQSFFLDLIDALAVDSVKMNSENLNFNHTDDILSIDFPVPINVNGQFTVIVYYQGIPGSSFTFGEHDGHPSIFTLSEPYGAKDWWPCKDTPSDKADSSEVRVTVRSDLTAVSNGLLTEVTDNGDTRTYLWKNSYPIAHYLISLAISDYAVYQQNFSWPFNNIMPVIHYIYPEHLDAAKPELDKTTDMLSIFSGLFGTYPFITEKYGHAEFGWGGGMEHQTISSMGSFTEVLIAHELAHQWFGDKITCRDWHHIWLNEGFATYAAGLYYEKQYGRDAYNGYINLQMANAKRAEGTLYVQDISSVQEIFNGLRSYSKGAVVLHMLRGITGDSVFFKILQSYINDPLLEYGTAVTEDFQRIAEEVSGHDLDYFFNEWVYGVNYPVYKAEWDYSNSAADAYDISLTIEQQQNDFPVYFTMPLTVFIKTGTGDTAFTVFNNRKIQEFNFRVSGRPSDLIIDPDNFVMKEILYTNPGSPGFPSVFILEQNYPNPFNSLTNIGFSVPVTSSGESKVVLKLYDITGKETAMLFKGDLRGGNYEIKFNINEINSSLSSGIYLYTLESGGLLLSRKMILMK